MASTRLFWSLRPSHRVFPFRQICVNTQRPNLSTCARSYAPVKTIGPEHSSKDYFLPLILRPSFWRSMVPIFLRKEARKARKEANRDQPWNPATFFIVMFLLIGSWGIHFINLRHGYAVSSRRLDNKIALLREVLKRVQAGEDVDVENVLGTGDPLAEKEWSEVMRNIEEEDRLWKSKERREARKRARQAAKEAAAATLTTENAPTSSNQFANTSENFARGIEPASQNPKTPGFY